MQIKEREGLTFEETRRRFHMGIATLFRWQRKIEPCVKRNKPATKIDMEKLKEDVEKHPDDYQWERAQKFKVSPNGILYALRRLGKSYKKNSVSSQSRRISQSRVPRSHRTIHKGKEDDNLSWWEWLRSWSAENSWLQHKGRALLWRTGLACQRSGECHWSSSGQQAFCTSSLWLHHW